MNIEESDPSPRPESGPTPADAAASSSGEFRPSRSRRPRGGGGGKRPPGDAENSGGEGETGRGQAESSGSAAAEGASEARAGGGERRRSERSDSRRGGGGRSDERSGSSRRGPKGRGDRDDRPPRGGKFSSSKEKTPKPGDEAPDKTAAPADNAPLLKDLGGKLLPAVSRSFSLTINLLPAPLREPITVGYLLARAMDTVADASRIPAAKRLEHLRAMLEMLKYGADPELLRPLQKDTAAGTEHEGERELIKELPRVLQWLEDQALGDRWELRRTLARIGRGQELDILRFGEASGTSPKPLETATELDEYTYFVAGSAGELWTRLCQSHLPEGWSKLPESEMLALGKRFGQGLQMVNILRDLPADLADGRCYLPADLLAKHGLDATRLREDGPRAKPLLNELRHLTLDHLDAAWKYVMALGPRKLRFACALPVLIGLETLALLVRNPALETEERVKMSRASLRKLMASAAVGAVLTSWLENLHKRLRQRAEG